MADADGGRYFHSWDDRRFGGADRFYAALSAMSRGIVSGDVLDIGCGSRVRYDTAGASLWVGVDLSAAALRGVQFLGGGRPAAVCLVQGSARHLPFAAGTFDTLCSIFLLHHLAAVNARRSRAAIIAALAECRRVLRPTGKLLVAETWPFRLMHLYHALYPMLYPTARRAFGVELPHFFAPSALEEMARSAGFREVAVAPVRIFEPIRQPVLGITLPAWLQRLLHSFAVYTIRP